MNNKITKINTACVFLSVSFLLSFQLSSIGSAKGRVQKYEKYTKNTQKSPKNKKIYVMKASYYGDGFHGRRTANGEIFNKNSLTAAHKTLPFGTKLKVTYPESGKSIVVRINDRGPYIRGRDLDLSEKAAYALGMKTVGVANILVTDIG